MYTVLPLINGEKSMPLYPVTLGVSHTQKYISRPGGTNFHHILYVSAGEGTFFFNGTKRVISEGTAVFFKKGFPIDYGPENGNFKTSWITFDGLAGEQLIKHFEVRDYEILDYAGVELKISEIASLAEANARVEVLSEKSYSLLVAFFMRLRGESALPTLEKAKHFINQNFAKDLSIQDISSHLGISASLLFKIFREQEKITPIEYLQQIRICQACNMLVTKKINVSEVGSSCGFSDTSYFCKIFKQWVGCSPASYRKKIIDW